MHEAHTLLLPNRELSFTAELLHDIRSPLAVVLGALQELRDAGDDDDRAVLLDLALKKAHEVLDLANDVLLSSAITGRSVASRRVEMSSLVRAAVDGASRHARVRVVGACEDGLFVAGSHTDLGRVLTNLLDNALQHARELVSVTAIADADMVELVVEDDGAGIPQHLRASIFRPWTSARPSGIGLGLAIVHRIVSAHAGTIRAENGASTGARFIVRLPRACAS